ncbi:uncharacterized protein [Panulirus ornatus]|uniref:uncharacterized protein isoform X1 n=1 Tax=Panulirus ornatus TaxID=150431 RepID=UPI003A8502CF
MRVLLGAAVLLVATMSVLASEYHVEDANGLLDRFEAPTHRQIDYDYREGIELQPQDDIGFFQGNNLPRPSGLNSLGEFNSLVPSDGFEPVPPVGGPPPFTIPELSAPNHFPDFGPQAPRPPPAPPNSPASHSDTREPNLPTTVIVGPIFQGNRPKRRPNRRPGRIPHRRPSIRGRRRPQKQLVPKRESTDDGPAAGGIVRATNGGRGKTNGNRSQEEGISGFLKSFRRLIHRVI